MNCDLKRAEPFDGFRYDRFLASKDVFYTCFLYESPVISSTGGGNIFLRILASTHEGISTRIDEMFGDPHAALLAGLLLGDQRFTDSWEEKFQATGTTHIVAASGYNVTVVVFVLFSILVYFGVRRQYAYGFLLFGILLYVFLAGADAPIVRAGIMGSLVLTAKQLGRKTSMTNILLLAAVAMLIVQPRLLRDDVGFQLSALSTIALVYFAAPVEKWFSFVPKTAALRESLSATVAATLFTLPIILFSFGQFSLLSPIANLLILPVLPYAMAFGVLALFIGAISFSLGVFVAGPAWALLSYVLWVIDALAGLPFTTIDV
jgi:competence protein ComEC